MRKPLSFKTLCLGVFIFIGKPQKGHTVPFSICHSGRLEFGKSRKGLGLFLVPLLRRFGFCQTRSTNIDSMVQPGPHPWSVSHVPGLKNGKNNSKSKFCTFPQSFLRARGAFHALGTSPSFLTMSALLSLLTASACLLLSSSTPLQPALFHLIVPTGLPKKGRPLFTLCVCTGNGKDHY
jgi:hypothetical protein